jgi:hypothetical protein
VIVRSARCVGHVEDLQAALEAVRARADGVPVKGATVNTLARVLQGGNEFPTLQVRERPRHRGDELALCGAGGYQPCELVGDC